MEKFIHYLDNYGFSNPIRVNDYSHIVHEINKNYITNGYQNINYSGGIDLKRVREPYIRLNLSKINKIKLNGFPIPLFDPSYNSYSIWQNMHEIQIPDHNEEKEKKEVIVPKTKYVSLNIKVENLQDLIDIIDNHPYEEDTEYNIDLKSLHNIREELTELNTMVGLSNLKKCVLDQLIYFIQNLHIGNDGDFKHTVLYGPPGTGKTEIAKTIGKMYSKLGILKNNIFMKVTRADLIAGYLGQTSIKTQKVIEKCLGGVLFIDEAYSLASNEDKDSFSKECIDTICEALSAHKDNLMVIIAGYENELNSTFFRINQGLDSRFIWRFHMDPYNSKELKEIFLKKIMKNNWEMERREDFNENWFYKKKENFKNYGRDMEILFTYTKIAHSSRIFGKSSDLKKRISLEDLDNGYEMFLKHSKKKENKEFLRDLYV
jgi:SpoVK/Ycf46/Vps4 family AAA+-type ATPase